MVFTIASLLALIISIYGLLLVFQSFRDPTNSGKVKIMFWSGTTIAIVTALCKWVSSRS